MSTNAQRAHKLACRSITAAPRVRTATTPVLPLQQVSKSPPAPTSSPSSCKSTSGPFIRRSPLLQPGRPSRATPSRTFTSSTRAMTTPRFSAGTDVSSAQANLESLVAPAGNWVLRADGTALERALKFKTFKAAWTFMSSVAAEAKKQKHHPEWSNVYNRVFIRWTTHDPAGLSAQDIQLAKVCDEIALKDESRGETDAGNTSDVRGVADTVVAGAGDCCTPRKQTQRQQEKEKIEREEGAEGAQGSLAGVGGQPS